MSTKALRYFNTGIQIKGETADNSANAEGSLFVNSTTNRIKSYIEGAVREIVTASQSQILTNKTINAPDNTITNIADGNVSATAAIARSKLASGSANRVVVNDATGVQTDAAAITAARALISDANGIPTHSTVTSTELAQLSGITSGAVSLNGVQSLTNKSLVDSSTAIVDATDNTKQIKFDAAGTTGTSTTLTSSQTANRVITLPDVAGTVVTTGDTGTVTSTMIANNTIVDADINTAAAIARTKLASGTNYRLLANSATGVMSENAALTSTRIPFADANGQLTDASDFTAGTNNITLGNTKHLELQAATDSTTTGTNASLAAFTGAGVRLTNASLVSLANIPAGANGQELIVFNRTGVDLTIADESAAVGTAANRIFTGTSAAVSFKKNAAMLFSYDSTSARWQIIGGTGSGGSSVSLSDTLVIQDFESAVLADFTQTGLALTSTNVIKGTKAALLTHQAASTYSFKQVIAVDRKFRGYNQTLSLSVRSSASAPNLTILVTDETNSATLMASSQITTNQITSAVFNTNSNTTVNVTNNAILNQILVGATITGSGIPASTVVTAVSSTAGTITISNAATATATGVALKVSVLPATQKFSFAIPANCASISYTITALQEAGSPESYIDDVQIYLSQAAGSSTTVTVPKAVVNDYAAKIANNGTATITSQTGNFIQSVVRNSTGNVTVNFVPGLFTVAPAVVAESANGQARNVGIDAPTTTSVTVYTTVTTSGTLEDHAFNLTVTKQGVDWIDPTTSTTTTTIPLTSSVLVTQPDSILSMSTGTLSGAQSALDFTTTIQSLGTSIKYDSSTRRFVILEAGLYSVSATDECGTTSGEVQIFANISGVDSTLALDLASGTNTRASASAEVYLNANDYIRIGSTNSRGSGGQRSCIISKAGSLKQLNVSSDSKITIPTHQLRFEGASARGSTDTAIVKFDTQTITQGDGFTVVNTAANGTVVTIRKAGILTVTTTLSSASTGQDIRISKNQAVLTSLATTAETIAYSTQASANACQTLTGTTPVNVGDVIRVSFSTTPNTSGNLFLLSLQEQSVAVALQNVTPTYDNSDSAVRVQAGNGFGSTNTSVRRFSNTLDNFGTDITYTDSATLGGYLTVNKDGVYNISYTDKATTSVNISITKNSTSLSSGVTTLGIQTAASNTYGCVSGEFYLQKGDVIRAIVEVPGNIDSANAYAELIISRVGKTSGTVDVTPFVQIPQQDVQYIECLTSTSTFGSTNTGVAVITATADSNNGIIRTVSDAVNGTYYQVLKDCIINASATFRSNGANSTNPGYITRNSPTLTATNVAAQYVLAGTSIVNTNGAEAIATASFKAVVGDIIRVQRAATSITVVDGFTMTATAQSTSVASSTQQVSSDTMSFAFKATAIDHTVDPVGTFNTYTYAANTNTATIAGTAPTQTTSSMNINGIQVFARAFNATSTAASPARVDIFIGKGLKSKQVDAYASTAKASGVSYDKIVDATNSNGAYTSYNETTGILSIDAAYQSGNSTGSVTIGINTASGVTVANAYFVFNASKSPSLVTVPNLQQRVAYLSDVKANNTNGGSASSVTTATRTLNTIVDSTGIVTSLSSNQFVLPLGTYKIFARVPGLAVNNHKARLRNITDSITQLIGSTSFSVSTGANAQTDSIIDGEVIITSSKIFEIQHYTAAARATDGQGSAVGSGESEVFTQVTIIKIK